MGITFGTVQINFTDGEVRRYEDVANVSISTDWLFMRFAEGSRVQIPSCVIKELCESSEVFIKGVKDGKSNSN